MKPLKMGRRSYEGEKGMADHHGYLIKRKYVMRQRARFVLEQKREDEGQEPLAEQQARVALVGTTSHRGHRRACTGDGLRFALAV